MRHQNGRVFDAFRKRYFSEPTFLQLNILAWRGITTILFWVRFVIYKDLTRALVITVGADKLWFFLSCALRHFYRKTALPFPRDIRIILKVALLSVAAAIIQAECVQAFVDFMHWHGVSRSHGERLLLFSAGHLILYLAWSFGYFWIKAERHARQKSQLAAPAARNFMVPSFLLQPLVENGFKHAPPPWNLQIAAEVHGEQLKIEIRNNGNLVNYEDGDGPGMGLKVIRRRLEIHYPGRHSFQIQQSQGWVVATLELEGIPCSV